MSAFLTRGQLHGQLRDQGHSFWSASSELAPINVSPPSEEYITVGLDPDLTLKTEYRKRYFACVRNAEDALLIQCEPEFAPRGLFALVGARHPANNYFMLGPIRWLLRRIERFDRILLWPPDGFRGADGLDFVLTAGGVREQELPRLAAFLTRHVSCPAEVAAVVLDLTDVSHCEVFWEVANLVGVDSYDFFLSDLFSREVYCLHHHDKIVVSIPDEQAREALLDELYGLGDVIEDWSDFRSKSGDELV